MVQIVISSFMKDKANQDYRKSKGKSLKAKSAGLRRAVSAWTQSKKLSRKSDIGTAVIKLKRTMTRARSAYRRTLREAVGQLYGYSKALSQNPEAWERFRSDARLWEEHKRPKADADILRVVIKLAVNNENRASLYYRAVKSLYDADVPAEDVPETIRKGGGFQKLADAHAESKRQRRASVETSQEAVEPMLKKEAERFETEPQSLPSPEKQHLVTLKIFMDGSYELLLPDAFYQSELSESSRQNQKRQFKR